MKKLIMMLGVLGLVVNVAIAQDAGKDKSCKNSITKEKCQPGEADCDCSKK